MIICEKCQTKNSPDLKNCTQCGSDLLPGESIKDRIGSVIVGIIGGVVAGLIGFFLGSHPEIAESSQICLLTNPAAWLFAALVVPISSIALALRKTPEHIKYENRAKRHKELEPEQAVADLSKALEIAPAKEHARLLASRAEIYSKLGREEEATRDRLKYTYQEGAYADQGGLARMLGADKDAFVSSAIKDERKKLILAGKIKALGYCIKHGGVVELNEKFLCPEHPKPKPVAIRFVMPDEVESQRPIIETEYQQQYQKSRHSKMVILVVIGILLVLCILIPLLSSALSK